MRRPVLGLSLLIAMTGCQLPPLSPGTPEAAMAYRVAPPDLLSITVRPEPAITREVTVRPDGRIAFYLIGDVEVAGLTIEEIHDAVSGRIRRYIVSLDVTVDLVESRSRRYFVLG